MRLILQKLWFSANPTTLAPETFYLYEANSKLANTVMAGLAQRVFMLLGSCLCASASFLSFPDVEAPPHWPAAASHSLNPATAATNLRTLKRKFQTTDMREASV